MTLLESFARQEGYGANPTNRPTRNNNPGDIEFGKFALAHGAIRNDGGYAVFANPTDGYNCYRALLLSGPYRGLTIQQTVYKYCPPPTIGQPLTIGNRPDIYLRNVCNWALLLPGDDFESNLG